MSIVSRFPIGAYSMSHSSKQKKSQMTMSQGADRHELYELSVQCSEAEVDFVMDTFKKLRGRKPALVREDFCGTANVCCEWVRRDKKLEAIGVDLDPEVLAWGQQHNLAKLREQQRKRIHLLQEDVLKVKTGAPDIICAMNFSYWLLKERATLKQYFITVLEALKPDGIFFLDAYGGYDSFRELEEEREVETPGGDMVTYVWEQARFNPINHDVTCYIHFLIEDDSRMDQAFTYHWRLWVLPENQYLLHEVGFKVTIYWQGWAEDGEPDGEFEPATEGDADAGWICYIVAEKP